MCQKGGEEQANGDSDGNLDHQESNAETVLVHGTVARLSSARDDQAACESGQAHKLAAFKELGRSRRGLTGCSDATGHEIENARDAYHKGGGAGDAAVHVGKHADGQASDARDDVRLGRAARSAVTRAHREKLGRRRH